MDAKFDKIKYICDNALNRKQEPSSKYEKFVVMWIKGEAARSMPWTGIHQVMEFIQEKLEEGCTVQVKPYTREEWANKAK